MPTLFKNNPRKITKERLAHLKETLARLGDLSGIVHNLETDEIIGGNQRMKVFVVWKGGKYGYRQVRWDAETADEAKQTARQAPTWKLRAQVPSVRSIPTDLVRKAR